MGWASDYVGVQRVCCVVLSSHKVRTSNHRKGDEEEEVYQDDCTQTRVKSTRGCEAQCDRRVEESGLCITCSVMKINNVSDSDDQ